MLIRGSRSGSARFHGDGGTSDSPERWTFDEKLRRYHALGVRELVVFHVEADPGARLRVWDRIENDLVERVVTDEKTPCLTLGLTLLIGPIDEYLVGLRLSRDADGKNLVPTESEGRSAEAEARQQAESRIAELEKELATTAPRG